MIQVFIYTGISVYLNPFGLFCKHFHVSVKPGRMDDHGLFMSATLDVRVSTILSRHAY